MTVAASSGCAAMELSADEGVHQLLHDEAVRPREPVHLDERPCLGQLLHQREPLHRCADRGQVRSRVAAGKADPTCPPQALPTQSTGSVEPESVQRLFGGGHHFLEGEIPWHRLAFAVRRPVDRVHRALAGQLVVPARPQDRESTNRLCHNTTGGPVPVRRTCSRPRSVLTKSGLGVFIATSPFTSETETSVTVVSSSGYGSVKRSRPPTAWPSGSCWSGCLREFRDDLAAPRADAGYGDVREPHFQIFGNIRMGGIRLTELADRAQLSLAATSELVNDLADLGLPDPQARSGRRQSQADRPDRAGPGSDGRRRQPGRRHRAPVVGTGGREELQPDVPHHATAARRARSRTTREASSAAAAAAAVGRRPWDWSRAKRFRRGSLPAGPPVRGRDRSPTVPPSIRGRTGRRRRRRSSSGTPTPLSSTVISTPSVELIAARRISVAPPCLTALVIALSMTNRRPAGIPTISTVVGDASDTSRSG